MPVTEASKQGAYSHGQWCRDLGKSISYNPYRNTPTDDSELYVAWEKGWRSREEKYAKRAVT